MEVIDIGLDDLDIGNVPPSSVNFGSGIELLMNEKKRSSSNTSMKIDLEELDNLENELNALSGVKPVNIPESSGGDSKKIGGLGSSFGNFFGFGKDTNSSSNTKSVPLDSNGSGLGQATAESANNTNKTWDGFAKIGAEIPKSGSGFASSANMTERERRRKKRMMIKKLEEWYDKGLIKNSSRFTMDSNYEEVEDEYEGALEDKRKKDSIKLQGWWFTTVVNTLEYGNALLNPFDFNLDGWGEQVSEDLDSYEEIFAELHEKYKGGKMSPELSLLLRLGFSAAVVNMSNKMLSSATPGFGDVMKQSPELMRMFTNAAVDTMSKQSPTFEFAKNMMNPPEQVSTKFGPPPAAMETKNMGNMTNRSQVPISQGAQQVPAGQGMQFTPNPGSRPDLAAARPPPQTMFREQGVDIQNNYQSAAAVNTNISRPEMRGPQMTDIDNLLSGLKTKPVSVTQPQMDNFTVDNGADSMISITSLKDLEGGNMPKRSNRKPRQNKSDKNMVSLDI
jgi:hypothetical protein